MSKWSATISLGEGLAIAANVGVIIGIVFVWMELRQNQTQLEAEIELSLAASYQEMMGRTIENDHVAAVLATAYSDPESLSQAQALQLMAMHSEWMSVVYATYSLWQSGAISEETWLMHSNYYLEFLTTEWLQNFWRAINHEGMYPDAFMRDLESRMPSPQ